MNANSSLMFVMPEHAFEYKYMVSSGYNVQSPYNGKGMLMQAFRKLWFKLGLPGKSIWFNKKLICHANDIIVYEPLIIPAFMKWMREVNPESRILLFYLNPVATSVNPNLISKNWCAKGAPDKTDCEKYGLTYMICGGYFRTMKVYKQDPLDYDIVYIGRDKGRLHQLENLENEFNAMGLRTYFHIVSDRRYNRFKNKKYKTALDYAEVLELLGKTKAILHLSHGCQDCVTFRVLESLFHEIKLVTDQTNLRCAEFYHPHNIFFLGMDNGMSIQTFLKEPYHKVDDKLIEKYGFDKNIRDYVAFAQK